jgi:hypothetical protein
MILCVDVFMPLSVIGLILQCCAKNKYFQPEAQQ